MGWGRAGGRWTRRGANAWRGGGCGGSLGGLRRVEPSRVREGWLVGFAGTLGLDLWGLTAGSLHLMGNGLASSCGPD